MQITVFGANGQVGRLAVAEALKKGFIVRAFVHNKSSLVGSSSLIVVKGDIRNLKDVEKAIKGSGAVVSTLGSWGSQDKNVLTNGMKNIIPTMHRYKINRIVSLTGADATFEKDTFIFIDKLSNLAIRILAQKIIKDGEQHIKLLNESGLNWTVVRSPIMNNRGINLEFKLTNIKPLPWQTINRNSVALSLIELLSNDKYYNKAIYISRK